jgi:Tannase-like family of unknown function (DUF6351)
MKLKPLLAALAISAALPLLSDSIAAPGSPFGIKTLSTHPDRVSGGDVLVEVSYPNANKNHPLVITLNGNNITSTFRPGSAPNTLIGLVTGLVPGKNTLAVEGKGWGVPAQTLEITNYSIKGPIISGPHIAPFICQTQNFNLPAGLGTLGAPLDADCSIATRVDYLYMSTAGGAFRQLPSLTSLPGDVATATTRHGVTVPFVVRLETRTINRGIFQSVVLHDPTSEPAPSPFSPPKGWNKGLIHTHGGGCPGGWYIQGASQGTNPVTGANITRLREGWGIILNTLTPPAVNCNAMLGAETAMMGKEHWIETFGVPNYTITLGSSGGAITSQDLADMLPGLFDGAIPISTFPDSYSIANAAQDARLLSNFFGYPQSPNLRPGWTDAQRIAVSGYKGIQAFLDDATESQRMDPVMGRIDFPGYEMAQWSAAVPMALRYVPLDNKYTPTLPPNPTGARPTLVDWARNVYGIDPATGFGLRPWDNVGVQYGLKALNDGVITVQQFLDVNEFIGGFDNDANYIPQRTVAHLGALKRIHQSGLTLYGGNGLANIPVLDAGGYNDTSGHHYAVYHFMVRERLKEVNGNADNHIMWRGPAQAEANWQAMVRWVEAIKADTSNTKQSVKVVRNKPADIVDGCWNTSTNPPTFIAEPQILNSEPNSQCNTLYPGWLLPRIIAGGPVAANILKCQLKPVDLNDYKVPFTGEQMGRLLRIFPDGVCDWSKPGVNFGPSVTWPSFGPSPDNLVFDVTNPD